ncbi:TfuA-like protein [Kitasatospora sp. NPDC096128]|uniref:TfuA-like protein n=1 Tax=Kitasatospora sp. NPDC096128 TaxID=3155547 RepID=UPI00332DF729
MGVHVFVGPSCPEPEIRSALPAVTLHGPVRHGDLFAEGIDRGDIVVILDGIYHQSLALRHKEILDAIDRGITVIGAASIGALRAVELEPHGMIGVGKVFQWYRTGVFDGDDAVSVAHGDSGSLVGLNVPLVNLYSALTAAQGEQIISPDGLRGLLALFEAVYYPLRSREHIASIARENGEDEFAAWFESELNKDPARFDQKRSDALAAMAAAKELAGSHRTRNTAADPAGARDWRTEYHRRWRSRFQPGDGALTPYQRVSYQQIFRDEFPEVWWRYLEFGPGRPGHSLAEHVRLEVGHPAAKWPTDPHLANRITSLICPVPDLSDAEQQTILLDIETAGDRDTAQRWLTNTREHLDRNPGRSLSQIAESTCTAVLAHIWFGGTTPTGRQHLKEESARRGFLSLRQAADAIRPFVMGYLADISSSTDSSGPTDFRKHDHVGLS